MRAPPEWRRAGTYARGPLTVAAVVLLGGLAVRARWFASDLQTLAGAVIPDDAFYYFQIARRLWTGGGVTFDGVEPATGLHPLWLALISPFFAGGRPGALGPVLAVLVLGWLLTSVAALQVARAVRETTGDALAALGAAAIFALHPWVVRESLNGLETALSLALVAWFIAELVRYLRSPSARGAWTLGALGALSCWARSDSLVILVAPCALLLVRRAPWRQIGVVAALPASAVSILAVATWWLTGSPLQSSATALPWLIHSNWGAAHPGADSAAAGWGIFAGALRDSSAHLGALPLWAAVAALAIAVAASSLPRVRSRVPGLDWTIGIVLAAALGLLALHFIHGAVRWYPRTWYFVGAVLLAALIIGVGLASARELAEDRRWRFAARLGAGAALALVVANGAWASWSDRSQPFPWQVEMYQAGAGLDAATPPGAVVGSFNSGIIAYLSDRTVINLDGVVNEAALEATRSGSLLAYMQRRGIGYLCDYPAMWSQIGFIYSPRRFFGGDFAAQDIARFDVDGVGWPAPGDAVVLARLAPQPALNASGGGP